MRPESGTGLAILLLVGTCLGGPFIPAAAEERVNPFATPMDMDADHGGRHGTQAPVELQLRATMPSADRPLANIGGEILEIGETFAGYELIQVSVSGVVLARGEDTIELLLRPDPNTEDHTR